MENITAPEHRVTLRRRFFALVYDTVAAVAVLYFAAFVPVLAAGGVLQAGNPLFTMYLLVVLFAYFWAGWRRGRTLGMQAWKFEIRTRDGGRPDARTCVVRMLGAGVSLGLLGAGYFAALLDPERRSWHDRWSGTQLVRSSLTAAGDS